jgi:hypothetical protein
VTRWGRRAAGVAAPASSGTPGFGETKAVTKSWPVVCTKYIPWPVRTPSAKWGLHILHTKAFFDLQILHILHVFVIFVIHCNILLIWHILDICLHILHIFYISFDIFFAYCLHICCYMLHIWHIILHIFLHIVCIFFCIFFCIFYMLWFYLTYFLPYSAYCFAYCLHIICILFCIFCICNIFCIFLYLHILHIRTRDVSNVPQEVCNLAWSQFPRNCKQRPYNVIILIILKKLSGSRLKMI